MLPLIAIDGPAGAGKSTTSLAVAHKLGLPYLDTGAIYRAATWGVMKKGINPKQSDAVSFYVNKAEFSILDGPSGTRIFVDGLEATSFLRSQEVTKNVSDVCEISSVRDKLVALQRHWANRGFGVVEGRDIGTVVLPNAGLKIYMTASPDIRAIRRGKEMNIQNDPEALAKLTKEIANRDERDSSRANSPLKPAEDALLLDTSNLTFNEQISWIIERAAERFKIKVYGTV